MVGPLSAFYVGAPVTAPNPYSPSAPHAIIDADAYQGLVHARQGGIQCGNYGGIRGVAAPDIINASLRTDGSTCWGRGEVRNPQQIMVGGCRILNIRCSHVAFRVFPPCSRVPGNVRACPLPAGVLTEKDRPIESVHPRRWDGVTNVVQVPQCLEHLHNDRSHAPPELHEFGSTLSDSATMSQPVTTQDRCGECSSISSYRARSMDGAKPEIGHAPNAIAQIVSH